MRVVANGKEIDVPTGATARDLVDLLGLSDRSVVVELNGAPLPRSEIGAAELADGDRLEVVRPVQGGSL